RENAWTRWPSREALGHEGISVPRRLVGRAVRVLVLGLLLWSTFHDGQVHGWVAVAGAGGVVLAGGLAWAFFRTTLQHRLGVSLALILLLTGLAAAAHAAGFGSLTLVVWCGCAIVALERMPLAAAL